MCIQLETLVVAPQDGKDLFAMSSSKDEDDGGELFDSPAKTSAPLCSLGTARTMVCKPLHHAGLLGAFGAVLGTCTDGCTGDTGATGEPQETSSASEVVVEAAQAAVETPSKPKIYVDAMGRRRKTPTAST